MGEPADEPFEHRAAGEVVPGEAALDARGAGLGRGEAHGDIVSARGAVTHTPRSSGQRGSGGNARAGRLSLASPYRCCRGSEHAVRGAAPRTHAEKYPRFRGDKTCGRRNPRITLDWRDPRPARAKTHEFRRAIRRGAGFGLLPRPPDLVRRARHGTAAFAPSVPLGVPTRRSRSSTTGDPLAEYTAKRDFAATPEPAGSGRDGRPPTPASRASSCRSTGPASLHWDLRLEHDGVLASWAVPKGIPADPRRNHLAVHTEDHPLEYLTFSGEIPPGEYGAGSMNVWDSGTYECHKFEAREVQMTLHGEQVRGRYVLFQTRGRRLDDPSHGSPRGSRPGSRRPKACAR